MIRQTSIQSFHEIQESPILSESYQQILTVLKDSYGLTDREIAKKLGFSDPNKVRPRRNELMKQGIIKDCGTKVCRVSGKWVHFWDAI